MQGFKNAEFSIAWGDDMGEERNRIIIEEIEMWKKNRLLPEMYCNYLLALYSKGDKKTITTQKFPFQGIPLILIQFCILIITLFFIYGNFLTTFQQLTLLTLIIATAYLIIHKYKSKQSIQF